MHITSESIPSLLHTATLVRSRRITPPESRDEVLHLVFRSADPDLKCSVGQTVCVLAPGEYGNRYHPRIYSIADVEQDNSGNTSFALCVRRCFYIDEVSGEQLPGITSNFLCNLRPGDSMEFAGPIGYPFAIPDDPAATIVMIGMGTGIAPFRGMIRTIYERHGGWQGQVRLYYGARTGLDMLYMNDENSDLANYYDRETFKAFQAVSPRPHFNVPAELDKAIEQNAAEMWAMLQRPDTHVYLAGVEVMQKLVDKAMTRIAGSPDAWNKAKATLTSSGRWKEVLY